MNANTPTDHGQATAAGPKRSTALVMIIALLAAVSVVLAGFVLYQASTRNAGSTTNGVEISQLTISVTYRAGSQHFLSGGNGCLRLNCPFSINATTSPTGSQVGGFQFWIASSGNQFGQANVTGISSPFTFTFAPPAIFINPGQAYAQGTVFVTCPNPGSFPVTIDIVE